MLKKDSPKEICDEMLGVAYQAAGLAVALDNAIFFDNGGLQDIDPQTLKALDGIAKALCRSTDMLVDQIEALDLAADWSVSIKDSPKFFKV
ncbi:hypothetical protein [uncultured Ruegeria sp.]|uniref:hypothetical protein n=1 Tax=uncultured Ruegeria sp. TaxID=259304 RepID=UPI00260E59D9|nr:hypothetical protein [uncultured Ruegeria sp.]